MIYRYPCSIDILYFNMKTQWAEKRKKLTIQFWSSLQHLPHIDYILINMFFMYNTWLFWLYFLKEVKHISLSVFHTHTHTHTHLLRNCVIILIYLSYSKWVKSSQEKNINIVLSQKMSVVFPRALAQWKTIFINWEDYTMSILRINFINIILNSG